MASYLAKDEQFGNFGSMLLILRGIESQLDRADDSAFHEGTDKNSIPLTHSSNGSFPK